MKIALLVQYDGSAYCGWQIQKDPKTVQGCIELALQTIFDQKINLIGSGRTDSGVHALGQVAHFEVEQSSIPPASIWKALNRQLPDDIRLIDSARVSEDFHSRFEAVEREYRYQILTAPNVLDRHTKWYIRFPINPEKLHETSRMILGEHDFSSFCYAGTETENMICNMFSADWSASDDGTLSFTIRGNRFLHHMVRMLVGSMIEVARGKWDLDHFAALLHNPNRRAHTVTAPARGLALQRVTYPESIQPTWHSHEDDLANSVISD